LEVKKQELDHKLEEERLNLEVENKRKEEESKKEKKRLEQEEKKKKQESRILHQKQRKENDNRTTMEHETTTHSQKSVAAKNETIGEVQKRVMDSSFVFYYLALTEKILKPLEEPAQSSKVQAPKESKEVVQEPQVSTDVQPAKIEKIVKRSTKESQYGGFVCVILFCKVNCSRFNEKESTGIANSKRGSSSVN